MYTLGIPKRDYRRATQVLGYESQPQIPYHANLQDDGFYLFTFPEAGDEDDFRAIVIKLKGEGVRVIGADAQLTEREIMKLVDLVPLKEESTGAFGATSEELADMYSLQMLQQFRDEVMMDMEQQAEPEGGPIADMYGGQLNGLDKAIAIKRGKTKDVPYDVAIGRMTQDEYDKMMSTVKPDSASFEKSSKFDRMNEGTCGYSVDGKPANKPAGPDLLRKAIRKEIRDNFDDRLKSFMGADDFEKATNPKLSRLINNAIMSIDPNMSYVDFAKGVAQVLRDEYNQMNQNDFIRVLRKELDI